MSDASIDSRPARWPWSILAGFLITAGIASIFVVRNGESFGEQVPYIIAFSMFGAVGALIVSRESRNRIGLLLLWTAGITALSFASQEIATYLIRRGDHGFLVGVIAIFGSAGWLFGILPAIFLLPILFPTGRPHSRRWRPLPWIVLGMLGFLAIGVIFGTRMLTDANDVALMRNPLYIPALGELGPIWDFGGWFLILLIASGASQVMRFVASEGVERQQIKWFAFAIIAFVAYLVVSDLMHFSGLAESIASGISFMLLPVAIGVSVLQYRLWDLDVVVKKAVVAGVLVVLALAVYAGAVALVGVLASDRESTVTLFLVALALGDRVPARDAGGSARRGPARLRGAGDPVRGVDGVLGAGGDLLRDGGRPPADGPGPRGGVRSRGGARVAPVEPPPPPGGRVAGRCDDPRSDPGVRRRRARSFGRNDRRSA